MEWLFGEPHLLLVGIGPRLSKTETFSIGLSAFIFGKLPDSSVIGGSYAMPLARTNNRAIQQVMQSEAYQELFDTRIPGEAARSAMKYTDLCNTDYFDIIGHRGSYKTASIGSGLSGFGMDYGIIDDPVKNWVDANSPTIQERNWNWYDTVWTARFNPGRPHRTLVVATRWAEHDLSGKLIKFAKENPDEKVRIINIPSLYETKDPHPDDPRTREDEALWPEGRTEKELKQLRRRMGSYRFGALYQGRPSSPKEVVFDPATYHYYTDEEIEGMHMLLFGALDPAISKSAKEKLGGAKFKISPRTSSRRLWKGSSNRSLISSV